MDPGVPTNLSSGTRGNYENAKSSHRHREFSRVNPESPPAQPAAQLAHRPVLSQIHEAQSPFHQGLPSLEPVHSPGYSSSLSPQSSPDSAAMHNPPRMTSAEQLSNLDAFLASHLSMAPQEHTSPSQQQALQPFHSMGTNPATATPAAQPQTGNAGVLMVTNNFYQVCLF